jgi:glycosyltransferase involved in cell wall biosynthesis
MITRHRPIRLTVVQTHPVQYYAPWFRHIAARCPELDLTVLYATAPTAAQQGVGFGVSFQWDTPLVEGYRCRILRAARPRESVHSERFWGLDVPEIGAALGESRPDVALIPGWHSVTLARALWACRRARIPTLYRGDTHLGLRPTGWRGAVWGARTRRLVHLFDGHLSVGTRAREYLTHFGVDPCGVFDAPHAVDNGFFARTSSPHRTPDARMAARVSWGLEPQAFVVLFVGKLEPKKRPLDLIRAMGGLGSRASVLVVGTGELMTACRGEADRLGLRAAWAGFLNQSELGRAYAVADCLVLPSDWAETWGVVVNEALATGLPCVVADRVGCAPDLVTQGKTGEVFPTGNLAELTAALGRIRAAVESGRDYAHACRERAASHSFDRTTAGLLAACRAMARPRASVRSNRPAGDR